MMKMPIKVLTIPREMKRKSTEPIISNSPVKKKTLARKNLPSVAKYIAENNISKIVTMGGAYMSEAAFQSPRILGKSIGPQLPNSDDSLFNMDRFREDPKPFYNFARKIFPGKLRPTLSHYFVRMLHEKGLLLRHYTKNLDHLEREAGIPEDKIIESHGTFYSSHCIACDKKYDFGWLKERIMNEIPKCNSCGGIVRPDIVFVGEDLPERYTKLSRDDFFNCDLLIILGSSLEAQPFSSLVDKVRSTVPRLLINRKIPPVGNPVLWGKGISTGMHLSPLDVTWKGECDIGCTKLAEMLNWLTELRDLHKKECGLTEQEGSPRPYGKNCFGKLIVQDHRGPDFDLKKVPAGQIVQYGRNIL